MARLIFRKAAFVTAVSASLKQLIISELRIWEEEIFVFPMPVDIEKFYPLNVEQPHQGKTLSIGRLIQRKGYEYLLRACNELRKEGMKSGLTIIGSGPEKDISTLPNAMKCYLLDENLKTRIAEEGYRFVPSNFTQQAISKKLKAIYQRLNRH